MPNDISKSWRKMNSEGKINTRKTFVNCEYQFKQYLFY